MIRNFCVVLIVCGAVAQAGELNLPERPRNVVTGSEFAAIVADMDRELREAHVYNEIAKGNIPDFLRVMAPLTIEGEGREIELSVTPDVLAIGSDEDYFLMPMGAPLTQWVADLADAGLPTTLLSDAIHAAAPVKLQPSFIAPSPAMTTVPVFAEHNETLSGQRAALLDEHPLGALVAGHKKDVVTTVRIASSPGKVAIYGWHYPNGDNVQPLYLGHVDWYADYSHGIRLISRAAEVNGEARDYYELLADNALAPLISGEGVITQPRYAAGDPPPVMPFADEVAGGTRTLPWRDRFTENLVQDFTPAAPGGDGSVMVVRDTRGGIDTASVGYATDGDYRAEAWIYCDYRPDAAGYDRVGLFVRDDGAGLFEGQSLSGAVANNYSLTWDSHTGEVQCLRVLDGVPENLLQETAAIPSSGWRRFTIEAAGEGLRFSIDGQPLLTISDTAHARGYCGVGYHEFFADNGQIEGARVESFTVTALEAGGESWVLR